MGLPWLFVELRGSLDIVLFKYIRLVRICLWLTLLRRRVAMSVLLLWRRILVSRSRLLVAGLLLMLLVIIARVARFLCWRSRLACLLTLLLVRDDYSRGSCDYNRLFWICFGFLD